MGDYCYVADTQANKMNKLLTFVGSNYGKGECLRGFGFDDKDFVPLFNIKENRQRVRCSWLNRDVSFSSNLRFVHFRIYFF